MALRVFFDTETTGLPEWNLPLDDERQPHLVQLAAILADESTRKVVASIDLTIRPDGWEIPERLAALHGTTTERALEVGVPEPLTLQLLMALARNNPRTAHNRQFDERIIAIAQARYPQVDTSRWNDPEQKAHSCTMAESKPILKLPQRGRGYGFKPPKMAEAYEYFTGKELKGAHTALADTTACMEVYWALLDGGKKAPIIEPHHPALVNPFSMHKEWVA